MTKAKYRVFSTTFLSSSIGNGDLMHYLIRFWDVAEDFAKGGKFKCSTFSSKSVWVMFGCTH